MPNVFAKIYKFIGTKDYINYRFTGRICTELVWLCAGGTREGRCYISLGSPSWIAVSSAKPIVDTLKKPYVFTHCVPGMFVSSTAIFAAGSSFRWLRDTLCRDLLSADEPYDETTRIAYPLRMMERKV